MVRVRGDLDLGFLEMRCDVMCEEYLGELFLYEDKIGQDRQGIDKVW